MKIFSKFFRKVLISSVFTIQLILAFTFVSTAQETLELFSSSDPTNRTGPTLLFENILFKHNIDNGTDDVDTPYLPSTTVTVQITNNFDAGQTYFVSQNTNNDDSDGENPPLVIGWEFTNVNGGTDLLRNGIEVNSLEPFTDIGQSLPPYENNTFDPTQSNALYTSGNTAGEGINVDLNQGVRLAAGLEGLDDQPYELDQEYNLATLTISFSRPLSEPILHFHGLGGIWETFVDQGGTRYQFGNSATLNFELTEYNEVATVSDLTLTKLSGTDSFTINDVDKLITNDADIPDAGNEPGFSGVGNGSVLVSGVEISSLTFNVTVRSSRTQVTSDTPSAGDGWDYYVLGSDELGWNGNTTGIDMNTFFPDAGGGLATIDLSPNNFASDAIIFSVSSNVQPDEVLLTEGDSYRMLTSPVVSQVDDGTNSGNIGITYDELIGQLWTQRLAGTGNGYDDEGSPNIFTWAKGTVESNGWQTINNLTTDRINPGEGFLMTVFEDDNFDGTIEDGTQGTGGPIEEFGNPNGNKLLSVTGSEAAPPILVSDNGTGQENGWILAGNPYKEPIGITELLTNRLTNLNQVVYIWDRGFGAVDSPSRTPGWRFATTDGTTPPATDSQLNPITNLEDSAGNPQTVILPFQGFFLEKTDATQSTVTFDDDNTLTRSTLVTTSDSDDQFFRKDRVTENLLVLNLKGESLENSLWFRFSENGSNERLTNDVLELASYNEHYAYFSTKKEEGDLLTLAQLPVPNEETEIPVTIETTRAGSYTINASEANLSLPYDLYFVDLQNEESIRIDQNFSYTFSVNQAAKSNPVDFTLKGPQKAKTVAAADRFLITTQPKEFGSELPNDVALNQNYPNPFNPTTQITYQLPQQSDVRLQVFDMAGRQVATLVNESVNAGTHTVNFDASSLSSGVYLYKLQAGSTVLTRKLTLIK